MRRIRTREAAEMLGLSPRGVQALAARGQLPGAAKIGTLWTFDPDKLRRFVETKETECASANYSKVKASAGCAPPPTDSNIEKAYELAKSRLLGKSGTSASRNSKRRTGGANGGGPRVRLKKKGRGK